MNRNLFKTLVVILGIFVTFTASANYDPNDEYEVFIQDDRNQTDFVEYLVKQKLRAQELLENYITNIGNAVGKQYSIKWIYVDAEGRPLGSIVDQTVTSTENEESST